MLGEAQCQMEDLQRRLIKKGKQILFNFNILKVRSRHLTRLICEIYLVNIALNGVQFGLKSKEISWRMCGECACGVCVFSFTCYFN